MPETQEELVANLLEAAKKAIKYCWDQDIQLTRLMQVVAKIEGTYQYDREAT
jgi:hypothetical protein